jgi:hypothetical protein
MAMPAVSHPSGRDRVNVTSIWMGGLRGWLDCGLGLMPLSWATGWQAPAGIKRCSPAALSIG